MIRTSFRYPAPADTLFAPGAFDDSIGREIDINIEFGMNSAVNRTGTLVGADVAPDGLSVWVTIETEEPVQ